MLGGIKFQLIKSSLSSRNVPSTQDKVVRLIFLKQLFDDLESLFLDVSCQGNSFVIGKRDCDIITRPEEVPVAITFFAVADILTVDTRTIEDIVFFFFRYIQNQSMNLMISFILR